jgi:hypothetical protein
MPATLMDRPRAAPNGDSERDRKGGAVALVADSDPRWTCHK